MQFSTEFTDKDIAKHNADWQGCTDCPLGTTCKSRSQVVLWRGYVPCDILFVGEAPGRDEDASGYPFVGQAGQLLDDLIVDTRADLSRTGEGVDVILAFTNVVCCMPLVGDKYRAPTEDEIRGCSLRLVDFVQIANPSVIILVGKMAELATPIPASAITHKILHPSFILQQPKHKRSQLYLRTKTVLRQAFLDTIPF